ncbi:MAG: NAD(P)H-hydrate epimerase [Candidatus Omnitrophica bacterium]|nr:NAD(P)H-hydrate epimerase [Candidatus Omnitrophota bacterium]
MRAVTAAEMREIDRRAIEEFGIPSFQLMEKAGEAVAQAAAQLAGPPPKKILVLAGKGNNGGDGLVAARLLHDRGYHAEVLLFSEREKLKADPARNFVENAKRSVPTRIIGEHFAWETIPQMLEGPEVVIDALFGVGLDKPLGEPYLTLIQRLNREGKKVVSADIPSGLHADTGQVLGDCVRATVTVTMGLPKKGFYEGEGPEVTGRIAVADIGIPKEVLNAYL